MYIQVHMQIQAYIVCTCMFVHIYIYEYVRMYMNVNTNKYLRIYVEHCRTMKFKGEPTLHNQKKESQQLGSSYLPWVILLSTQTSCIKFDPPH